MASPFRIFRKNKKVMMAGLVIMAMFAFVVLTPTTMNSLGRGGREPIAISTKFGSLTQSQIIYLRSERKSLISFFQVLGEILDNQKNNEAAATAANSVKTFRGLLGQETAEEAIRRWVYGKTAASMGIAVDNSSVNDLLNLLMRGVPDSQKAIGVAMTSTPGGMNPDQLVSLMRKQLLALRLMQLGHQCDYPAQYGAQNIAWAALAASPGERWDYFKRLHQDASIELAMLSPDAFVKDVKDPTQDELKQFFEQYKGAAPSPDSPEPGFFVPRRVSVQYLATDEANIESQITEKDITQEYDKDPKKYARDLEQFQKDEKEEKEARDKEESAGKSAPDKSGPNSKSSGTTPPATPEAKVAPATPPATPEAKPAPATPPATPEAKAAPATPPATPEAKPAPAKASASGAKPSGTSSAAAATPFRLAAYAVEKPADTATVPAATSGTTAVATPKPAEEKKPSEETRPAAESKSSAAPAVSKPVDAKSSGETAPHATNPAETKSKDDDAKKKTAPKKEAKPIKTARQRLNDMIQKELAGKKLRENIAKIRTVLDAYRSKFTNSPEGAKKPTPPDFAALAKEYGMTAGVTGLVSKQELFETDFGKSYVINGETGRYSSVLDSIFSSTLVFKADTSFSLFGEPKNRAYVFWKTDDQPGGEPKWDGDTERKVRREWKLFQARKLALAAADKLKAEISKSENAAKPLKDIVDAKQGFELVQPPKFTWLTSLLGERPTISKVGDLKNVGQPFMKKVFDLGPGQVTVATNLPQTEVYVIRMKELTSFKDLWGDFSSPDAPRDYLPVLIGVVSGEVDPAWSNQVMKDAGFVDNRKEAGKAAERQSAPRSEEPEGPPPPEDM